MASTRNLLLCIHFAEAVEQRYRDALAPLASTWTIRRVYAGAFSSAYTGLARSLRTGGNLLNPLLASAGAGRREDWGRVVLVSFSAGYALVRELLSGPDAELVDGWIAIDSGHAALEADGTALDAQVAPFVALARRALDGKALLWFGHTDVRTPQTGPQAFASTTQFADELLRFLGVETTALPMRYADRLLVVRAFDERKSDHDEHVHALTGWGPSFVTQALAALDGASEEGSAEEAPSTEPSRPLSLGDVLLTKARLDLAAGVREDLGPNDGRRIREYFAGTGFNPPANWCSAAVRFWMRSAALELGVVPPVDGSVGAKATMEQLKRAGRWIEVSTLRKHPERLRPGMIVVWHRGDPGAWTGHIGVCSAVEGQGFRSIEGNSGATSDRVAEMRHALDTRLLGAGWVD